MNRTGSQGQTTYAEANGVRLHYELTGAGEPVALVHGSWTNGATWARAADLLSEAFLVLTYDRRGHSRSERPPTQGSADEDGDDLAALLEVLELGPVHVVASSFGGNIALRLALRRPELFRSLSCHEPPLWGVLAGDSEAAQFLEQGSAALEAVARLIAAGDHEGAARTFVDEVIFEPGAWDTELAPESRATFVENAPTYLDEEQDPEALSIDERMLRSLEVPVRFTSGTQSPPIFGRVVDRLVELVPGARRDTIAGAGHAPHMTHPEEFAQATADAIGRLSNG